MKTIGLKPVYKDIIAERFAQDRQWGGPDHDDGHHPLDWIPIIDKQLSKILFDTDQIQRRSRFVKVAAIAVAAIESIDRIVANRH